LGLSAVVVSTLVATAAAGQTFHGGIRGSIRDANGIVPSAAVTLVDETTGLARASISNDAGEYAFVDVLPGRYALRATAPGYKTFQRSGLDVGAQTFLTIDVTLDPGAVSETITVTAAAPLIDTATASVGTL